MTRTTVKFQDQTNVLNTEWEAYVWLLNEFLRNKGDFFIAKGAEINYVCSGGRNAPQFAPSRFRMNQPKQLSNGWYAETCLNERQKINNLYKLAQSIGLSSESDYEWTADGRPVVQQKDVATLFKELDEL